MKGPGATSGEFYIGYASGPPPGLARFRRRALLVLALLVLSVAGLLGWSFSLFAPANFEFGELRHFSGVLEEVPIPTLRLSRQGVLPDGTPDSRYLLVGSGKNGAGETIAGKGGREVSLEGTLFYARGQTGIELVPGSLDDEGSAPSRPPEAGSILGRFVLQGEVVDTKCYLGVMNPGWGKVHKSCAVRCLSGGVPPGLLVRISEEASMVVLLTGHGAPLGNWILAYAGEGVRLEGWLVQRGDTLELQVEPSSFHPM